MDITTGIAELRRWIAEGGHSPSRIAQASGGRVSRASVYLALAEGPWNPLAETVAGFERARVALDAESVHLPSVAGLPPGAESSADPATGPRPGKATPARMAAPALASGAA